MPAGALANDAAQPVAPASALCIPKTHNVLIDGAAFDCTRAGCIFGRRVPVPNGALSACSVSTFTSPSTGTVNLVTGATTANVNLGLHLYVTGNAAQPCPRCSATGAPGAPGTGT